MHDPRLLAIAEAERQFFDTDYDDYNGTNSSGAAFCRSAALIVSLYYCKFIIAMHHLLIITLYLIERLMKKMKMMLDDMLF